MSCEEVLFFQTKQNRPLNTARVNYVFCIELQKTNRYLHSFSTLSSHPAPLAVGNVLFIGIHLSIHVNSELEFDSMHGPSLALSWFLTDCFRRSLGDENRKMSAVWLNCERLERY